LNYLASKSRIIIIIIIIIIGSTALGGPWIPQANVAKDLSWESARHFPQPSFLASSSTPSIHLDFGRPCPR
jgi:energy-converting hydrogenase Eha subunit A